MKWKKAIIWGSGIVLAGLAGCAVWGYCWLYGWSWGSMPAAHSSFKPDEVQRLQKLDSYLTGTGVEHFRSEALKVDLMMSTLSHDLPGETSQWEDDPEKAFSWWERQVIRYVTDCEIRRTFGPTRQHLHQLVETGQVDAAAVYLAIAAIHTHDIELVKLIIARGVNANGVYTCGEISVPLLCEFISGANLKRDYLPVSTRLELLEWLYAHGLDVCGEPQKLIIPMLEASIWFSGDKKGEILEWLLRHGMQVESDVITGVLLRYPNTLDTLKRLIQDKLLQPVPAEFVTEDAAYTPLQMVAANMEPSPETVRWLISLGHGVNELAKTVIEQDEEYAGAGGLKPLAPLDECLKRLLLHSDEELLEKRLEVLNTLLEYGARPTEKSRELMPHYKDLKKRVVELMEQHGCYVFPGEEPENPCCEP